MGKYDSCIQKSLFLRSHYYLLLWSIHRIFARDCYFVECPLFRKCYKIQFWTKFVRDMFLDCYQTNHTDIPVKAQLLMFVKYLDTEIGVLKTGFLGVENLLEGEEAKGANADVIFNCLVNQIPKCSLGAG